MKNQYFIPFNGQHYLARTLATSDGCVFHVADYALLQAIEALNESEIDLRKQGQLIDSGIVYFTTPEEMNLPDIMLENLIYN